MRLLTGIRCVEREPQTVWRTLSSLKDAGFTDLLFFVDGPFGHLSELEEHGAVIHRQKSVGAWPNLYLSLAELFMRDPKADMYMLVEDDVVFCKDLLPYLEQHVSEIHVASLFSSSKVEGRIACHGHGFTTLNPGWNVASGSQAWLFSNAAMIQFLSSRSVVEYRKNPPQSLSKKHYRLDGLHHTDCMIGRFGEEAGCGIQYHYPSLCQHIGKESYMYPGFSGKANARFSEHFPGEEVSAMQFLGTRETRRKPIGKLSSECVVLVPVGNIVEPACDQSLRVLESQGYTIRRASGHQALNEMITHAYLDGFDEFMLIAPDIEFQPEYVAHLRGHGLPLVCGISPARGKSRLDCHVLPETEQLTFGKDGGLHEILYAGTGFLHFRRDVLDAMRKEFELPICNEGTGKPVIPFFMPIMASNGNKHLFLSEEYAFSERARQCEYTVFADTSIRPFRVGRNGCRWEEIGGDLKRTGSLVVRFAPQT